MPTTLSQLRDRLGRARDLRSAVNLLEWDQEVNMPPKGAEARGFQLATLSAVAHRAFTDPEVGVLLDAASRDGLSSDDRALVSEARYDYDRAAKLPAEFVEQFAKLRSEAYEVWVKARNDQNFALFEPHLAKIVDMSRKKADYLGFEESPYDALLEDYERGMTASKLDAIFGPLVEAQSALIRRILDSSNQPDFPWLDQTWDPDTQYAFTFEVLRDMGYDFEAGRQDRSVHPFSTEFDIGDVRVTTRVDPKDLFAALTGSMHEGGHALYEQGFDPRDRRTPLAAAPSLGMHESQSRMWENMIGRSLPFWKHYAPKLKERWGAQLEGVTAEDIFRAINIVRPSFIRVEADECTYNLHVILRYEIERAMIEGTLAVRDIPEVWNEKVKAYLGLDVPNDAVGCLQDIHWSHGLIGYFPTYALGNLYAAQLFEQIERDTPNLWVKIEQGNFKPLLTWLRSHIHQHGRRHTASELVRTATGRAPDSAAYLKYLENKYAGLYGLS